MTADDEQQLDQIIADFLQAQEAGRTVSEQDVIAAHPELADELREFFDDLGQMDNFASPLAAPVMSRQPVLGKFRYFGDYELLEEIARGGMGIVYKAKQSSLNRTVAVKLILSGHLASETDVKRFQTEAESAANLQHPHIVSVFEVGRHDGQSYFSMEFIDGQNLSEIVRDLPLPPKRAAGYVREVADAIHYAHQQGTLHRDLKPSNVLIDQNDRAQITDFGLAMKVEGDSELTRTGQVLGTPSYMPPEQAQHKRGLIGPASDIYSIGAVLYELLTGRPPFQADSAVETLRQVIETEPLSPRQLNPAVPKDLETICLKCLQKEPHKRYATAQHLADDLGRFLHGEPILARPIGRVERTWRWCRRNSTVAYLIALIAVLLVTGTAISVSYAIAERQQRQVAQGALAKIERAFQREQKARQAEITARTTAENERTVAERQRRLAIQRENEARAQLYVAHMNQAHIAWSNDNLSRVRQLLAEHIPSDGEVDHRSFEWNFISNLADSSLRTFGTETHEAVDEVVFSRAADRFAVLSPKGVEVWDATAGTKQAAFGAGLGGKGSISFNKDGTHLAAGGATREIHIWELTTLERLKVVRTSHPIRCLRFHPTESLLACLEVNERNQTAQIRMIDITSGESVSLIEHPSILHTMEFRPDGRALAASDLNNQLNIWDVETGRVQSTWECPGHSLELAWSPDGTRIALASSKRNVDIYEAQSGKLLMQWMPLSGSIQELQFDRDGNRLLAGGEAKTLYLFETQSATKSREFRGHEFDVIGVAFGPNPGEIISADRDGRVNVWDSRRDAGKAFLPSARPELTGIDFSQDGRWMAYSSGAPYAPERQGHVQIFDLITGRRGPRLVEHSGGVFGVSFSRDGRFLASVGHGGRAIVWDVATSEPIRLFDANGLSLFSVAFSPDGKTVATGTQEGTVLVWETGTGNLVRTLKLEESSKVRCLAYAPNGQYLAAGNDNRFAVWRIDGRNIIRGASIPGPLRSISVAFSPDSTRFACGLEENFAIYDLASAERIVEVPAHSQDIFSLVFYPLGQRLVTKTHTGEIKIWDLNTLQSVLTLPKVDEDQPWNSEPLAISPDGGWIVAGQDNRGVVVWNARPRHLESQGAEQLLRSSVPQGSFDQKYIDQLARKRKWDQLARLMKETYGRSSPKSWKAAFLFFQVGNLERFRQIREQLLSEVNPSLEGWKAQMYFRIAILAPLESDLHPALRTLVDLNLDSRKPWVRNKIGRGMYRLGEFETWYASLEADSSLRDGHELLLSMSRYQSNASAENRADLARQVEQTEKNAANRFDELDLGEYWFDYVEEVAWIREAKSLLDNSDMTPPEPREAD